MDGSGYQQYVHIHTGRVVFVRSRLCVFHSIDSAPLPMGVISIPNQSSRMHAVARVRWNHIMAISTTKLPVDDSNVIMENKDETASLRLLEQLYAFGKETVNATASPLSFFPEIDYLSKNKDFEFRQTVLERKSVLEALPTFQCIRCPELLDHVGLESRLYSHPFVHSIV